MAVVYQISLHGDAFDARGKDWEQIVAESGCRPDRGWKDPIHDRTLLKTEFGCSVSHFRVWQKIARSGVAGIVLEEDAVFTSFDVSEIDGLLKSYDSVWLGHRENTLGYWYNAHAYAISPKTASMLCEGFAENIIPADEWLPLKLKNYSNYFYRPELVKQIPRSIRPSTIEKEARMQTHVLTVGTDQSKMFMLEQSSERHGINFLNLGHGVEWRGGSMSETGGGQKINLVRSHVQSLPDDDLVLFCDAYDVIIADNLETIVERFLGFDCDILFAAERDCWPDRGLEKKFKETGTPYRYLNSGLYMGKVEALKKFFHRDLDDAEDDQLWSQLAFLSGPHEQNVLLDTEAYVFQCSDLFCRVLDGRLINEICSPCIYHGNGGETAKLKLNEIFDTFSYERVEAPVAPQSPNYINTLEYQEVANEILITPLFTQQQCDEIIWKANSTGKWRSMEGDKFPAQEIRVREIGLWEEIEAIWKDKLGKIAEKHWEPMAHIGLRDAFVMKYTLDTQTSLGYHTDASLVTGSVKLNSNYEGGELVFPRQKFDNRSVSNGACILFPSEVTHGHKVDPLISGEKYSLTMWTSRFEGDVNG